MSRLVGSRNRDGPSVLCAANIFRSITCPSKKNFMDLNPEFDTTTCPYSNIVNNVYLRRYSSTPGLGPLLDVLQHLQQRYHHPPVPVDMCVTTGSQEALSRAFEMLLGPGDSLLVTHHYILRNCAA